MAMSNMLEKLSRQKALKKNSKEVPSNSHNSMILW